MEVGFTAPLLDTIVDNDSLAIHDICKLFFQMDSNSLIPKETSVQAVLFIMFKARLLDVGNRAEDWVADSVADDGTIDWSAKPLFECVWDKDGGLEKIVHMNGAIAVVPEFAKIDQSYAFNDVACDSLARFEKKPCKFIRKDFFTEKQGPNRNVLDLRGSMLKALAVTASNKLQAKQDEIMALADTSASVTLETRQKSLREEALLKARASLVARPKRLRSLTFGTPDKADSGQDKLMITEGCLTVECS
jgi:hypothetical protein